MRYSENYLTKLETTETMLTNIWSEKPDIIFFKLSKSRYLFKDIVHKKTTMYDKKRRYHVLINNTSDFFDNCVIQHNIKVKLKDLPKFYKLLNKKMASHKVQKVKKAVSASKLYLRKKEWEETLPKDIVNWAYDYIDSQVNDNCRDNYRCADMTKKTQRKRYRRDQNNGCCGFYDEQVVCPIDGKIYMVGCNYGH